MAVDNRDEHNNTVTTNIFITGGTGFIGRQFILELLKKYPHVEIYCLVRKQSLLNINKLSLKNSPYNHQRVHMVFGDITSSAILEDEVSVPCTIDEFWHVAGTTDFNQEKRDEIFRINLEGTKNAVRLAEKLKSKHFFHISTAYVAGLHEGRVLEDGLLPNPTFRNPYEESKYAAEKYIRESLTIPWSILRPAIVMGDTVTGEAESDKTVYGMAKLYYLLHQLIDHKWRDKGGIPTDLRYKLRAKKETTKNIVAVNEVVRLMLLVKDYGEKGKTYHLTASRLTNMDEMHQTFIKLINHPLIELSDELTVNEDPIQNFLNKNAEIYEPYLINSDPIFDQTNSVAISKDSESIQIHQKDLEFLLKTFLEKK